MAVFQAKMLPEVIQGFWAAMQRGEFITDAAERVGSYRMQGRRWIAASGGVRPRRGRDLKGRCLACPTGWFDFDHLSIKRGFDDVEAAFAG